LQASKRWGFSHKYLMQINEIIDDDVDHPEIHQWAQKQPGHQLIGQGTQSLVYQVDNGIVKYFIPDDDNRKPAERDFVHWIRFCQASGDPHLPRFQAVAKKKINGRNYIVVNMERLQPITAKIFKMVTAMQDWMYEYPDFATYQSRHPKNTIAQQQPGLARTWQRLDDYAGQTRNDYDLNSPGDNIMARADGTIVINDPFTF